MNQYTFKGTDAERPLPDLSKLSLARIAAIIKTDWTKPYFGARPYIEAMSSLHEDQQSYGAESAESIVLYFLSNAGTWRGTAAQLVKAELKRRFKIR